MSNTQCIFSAAFGIVVEEYIYQHSQHSVCMNHIIVTGVICSLMWKEIYVSLLTVLVFIAV